MIHEVAAVVVEPLRTQADRELIGRPAEVADIQFVLRKSRVQERLKVPEILHPFGERVADEDHVIVRPEFEHGQIRGREGRAQASSRNRQKNLRESDCEREEVQTNDYHR